MYQTETASKLGHLDVLKSEHVKKLIEEFEAIKAEEIYSEDNLGWKNLEHKPSPFKLIYCVDGSIASVVGVGAVKKRISFC